MIRIEKQGDNGEEIAKVKLQEKHAPCEIIKLAIDNDLRAEYNREAINTAINKLTKNDPKTKKLLETKLTEFEKYYREISQEKREPNLKIQFSSPNSMPLGIPGAPDFIIITKSGFRFAEIKTHKSTSKHKIKLRDEQEKIFPKLAKKYPLEIVIVIFKPNGADVNFKPYAPNIDLQTTQQILL